MADPMRAFAVKLGAKIAEGRRRLKLPQNAFAERAGVSKAYMSQIEMGNRVPSLAMLIGISGALGVDMRDLF